MLPDKIFSVFNVTVNPTKYHHPHYSNSVSQKQQPKLNIRKHLHKICFSIAIASFSIPLLTNPIFKEDDEELQRNIKIACYSSMIAASLIGYANEKSTKTLEMRRYQDMNINASYAINRHAIQLKVGRDYQVETIKSDLETLKTAETVGAYGLPFYPQSLAPIAMSRFAPQQEQTNGTSVNMGNLDPNVFQLPSIDSNEEDTNNINKAYDYIFDRTKRNYRGLLVCGDTGDNKTFMLHYVISRWLRQEPDSIFYVCDRKYFAEKKDITQRASWCGLPVYSDEKMIVKDGIPHPSVYAKFYPELEEWLEPVYKLLETRCGEKSQTATSEEQLINPTTGKFRPVVVLIDDATMIINGYAKDKQTRVNRIIDELTTLGRSAEIVVIFISHSVTASVTGLSTTTLTMLAPMIGTSFVGDNNILQFTKRPICPEGIQKCLDNPSGKKKYFATAWTDNPFVPPANFSQNMLLDCLIPELTKLWHQTCPEGFLVQDYHTKAIQSLGFKSIEEVRSGVTPASLPVKAETKTELTEKEAIVQLRVWANQNETYSHNELIAKFSEISGKPISELGQYGEQLGAVVSMSNDDFGKI